MSHKVDENGVWVSERQIALIRMRRRVTRRLVRIQAVCTLALWLWLAD